MSYLYLLSIPLSPYHVHISMEVSDYRFHPSSSSSSSPLTNPQVPSSTSSSLPLPPLLLPPPPPPPLQPQQEQEEQQQQRARVSYRINISIINNALTSETGDSICSCLVILLTFCCFASLTLILGFYGSVDLRLGGPNCSRLIHANSFFVQELKVKAASEAKHGTAMLYGFRRLPSLDVQTEWSESHKVSIPSDFHKEWMYYLNEHAHVHISYSLKPQASQPLILIIAQGEYSLRQWIEDPSHPNTTLSWNLIHKGNGTIQMNVVQPSNYYIAVANINHQEMEVLLNFKFQNLLYNTSQAYYTCLLDNKLCILKLFFLWANVGVLTTSGTEKTDDNNEWYVELSYGPRWIAYIVSSGAMTLVILLAFKIFNNLKLVPGNDNQQTSEVVTNRSSLLVNKDDDNLSLGSSYDSVSHDEEDVEGFSGVTTKLLKVGEVDDSCCFCTICSDAQKDCFFLPCGHSATCFTCGRRIADVAGVCPICQRKMKKVRKIFTV